MNGILFLTSVTYSHMGGMEIYNHQLASALGKKLQGNVFLLPIDDAAPVKTADAGYRLLSMARLHQLPSRILRDHLRFRWANWLGSRTIKAHRLDFVLCGYAHLLPLAAEWSRVHRIPYGVVGHGIEVWGNLAPAKLAALQNIDRGIAVSRFTAQKMAEKGVPASKLFILSPHVDTDHYRVDAAAGAARRKKMGWNGRKVLLTVGRLASTERYKGHEAVMKALSLILPSRPDLLYVIAGSGDDQPRLQALAAEWRLLNHVQFIGFVPEEEKVALYNACDVFIMVSQLGLRGNRWVGEGFGIVFLEAAACGKALIGPNVGGAVDAIEEGVTGLLAPPEDVEAIGRAILALAGDEALCRRLGEQGRERTERRFSLHALNNQVVEWVHDISERAVPV